MKADGNTKARELRKFGFALECKECKKKGGRPKQSINTAAAATTTTTMIWRWMEVDGKNRRQHTDNLPPTPSSHRRAAVGTTKGEERFCIYVYIF
jgi:hypothetical protein